MTDDIKEVGSKLGMEWRDGKSAEVGSTDRIRRLNKMFHSFRPRVELQRTRVLTDHFQKTEGETYIRRRYAALAKVFETLPVSIYDDEQLAGWQGAQPRSENINIEMCAHWLDLELDGLDQRPFDPFKISQEDKKELREKHIPYWKDKTLAYKWSKRVQVPEKWTLSCIAIVTNYISNMGTHFTPDYNTFMSIGFKGYQERARLALGALDETDPANLGKRDFYEGIIAVCRATRKLGMNYAEKARELAADCQDTIRKKELLGIAARCERVPYEPPRTFIEAMQACWFVLVLLNIEGSGPGVTLGRFDQFMYPLLKKDLDEGIITVPEALELIEELYLKITNFVWFNPALMAHKVGGYYRFLSLDVGGLNGQGRDASNLLTYLCIRALRYVRTTGPTVHVQIHQKTPDSVLIEAAKLTAEGMGHPSYFNVETLYAMLRMRTAGLTGKSPYTEKELREGAVMIGCVEPGVQGLQYGHTSSSLINLGNTMSLTMNNGIFPKGVPAWGAGTLMGVETGDPRNFGSFEALMEAVKVQLKYQITQCHAVMLVAEKLHAEEYQLPTFTILARGAVEKGVDVVAGGAQVNIGPTHECSGIADIGDSLAAIKKIVFEDKKFSMDALCKALDADFAGYETLRRELLSAPKYGNDDDYADDIVAEILSYFARVVGRLKCWKGYTSDPGIQTVQANVLMGLSCWALPSGRKALEPLADTLSAQQNMDVNGPTAAARSYGKIDHGVLSNGTILNMWISKSELVK
jgi:choline trimethylamine-lyase